MSTAEILQARSGNQCELCASPTSLSVYSVPPQGEDNAQSCVLVCATCEQQINKSEAMDANHWRCLNDSMWSQIPAVQVMAWRMLTRLSAEGWPQDLLDMLYLDEETLAWAKSAESDDTDENTVQHVDSNGAALQAGDTVTLIKDLNVKGAGFTAKRGTAVRNISVVADNAEHIEGRINGQQIVILTRFVKKSG